MEGKLAFLKRSFMLPFVTNFSVIHAQCFSLDLIESQTVFFRRCSRGELASLFIDGVFNAFDGVSNLLVSFKHSDSISRLNLRSISLTISPKSLKSNLKLR